MTVVVCGYIAKVNTNFNYPSQPTLFIILQSADYCLYTELLLLCANPRTTVCRQLAARTIWDRTPRPVVVVRQILHNSLSSNGKTILIPREASLHLCSVYNVIKL